MFIARGQRGKWHLMHEQTWPGDETNTWCGATIIVAEYLPVWSSMIDDLPFGCEICRHCRKLIVDIVSTAEQLEWLADTE